MKNFRKIDILNQNWFNKIFLSFLIENNFKTVISCVSNFDNRFKLEDKKIKHYFYWIRKSDYEINIFEIKKIFWKINLEEKTIFILDDIFWRNHNILIETIEILMKEKEKRKNKLILVFDISNSIILKDYLLKKYIEKFDLIFLNFKDIWIELFQYKIYVNNNSVLIKNFFKNKIDLNKKIISNFKKEFLKEKIFSSKEILEIIQEYFLSIHFLMNKKITKFFEEFLDCTNKEEKEIWNCKNKINWLNKKIFFWYNDLFELKKFNFFSSSSKKNLFIKKKSNFFFNFLIDKLNILTYSELEELYLNKSFQNLIFQNSKEIENITNFIIEKWKFNIIKNKEEANVFLKEKLFSRLILFNFFISNFINLIKIVPKNKLTILEKTLINKDKNIIFYLEKNLQKLFFKHLKNKINFKILNNNKNAKEIILLEKNILFYWFFLKLNINFEQKKFNLVKNYLNKIDDEEIDLKSIWLNWLKNELIQEIKKEMKKFKKKWIICEQKNWDFEINDFIN